MNIRLKQSGFTLIEIAVVLVIIGLLVGSFIGTFASRIDTTRRDEVRNELDDIKRVLMAHAFSKTPPHLPCPDTNVPPDGLEDRTAGVCDAGTAIGYLPWRNLGMGNEDAWANRYGYWVNNAYAENNVGFTLNSPDEGGSNAAIETREGDADFNMVQNAVAVIFSHGKNGLGAYSTEGVAQPAIPAPGNGHDDENENTDADLVFMARYPSEEGSASVGGVFDDIVVWINSYELKAKMVETGVLPSP